MQHIGRRELVTALSVGAGLSVYSRSAGATTVVTTPVPPTQYGASTSAADNTVALNQWLNALVSTTQVGIVDGLYKFTGTLNPPSGYHLRIVQPLAGRFGGSEVPYGLVYTGATNPNGVALQLTGISVVEFDHVTIDGGGKI